ncbi:MAG: DUF2892 domain-containing protein [Desulfamplus sp.]|nr:DUF2892 domain-containing protein [Desulfamplus sp.]
MNIDKIVFAVAGSLVLLSVIFAVSHSIHWLWLTGFIGANMIQAAFTGFCPLAYVLKSIGLDSGNAF